MFGEFNVIYHDVIASETSTDFYGAVIGELFIL
jgi:hypothetical protein